MRTQNLHGVCVCVPRIPKVLHVLAFVTEAHVFAQLGNVSQEEFFQCVDWTWCVVIICAAMQYVLWSALLGPNQFLGVRVAQSAFVTAAVVDGFHKRFVRVFC